MADPRVRGAKTKAEAQAAKRVEAERRRNEERIEREARLKARDEAHFGKKDGPTIRFRPGEM